MFYVYEHIRNDTDMVFYVGKGYGFRSNSKHNRNKHWHNIVNKAGGFTVNKIAEDLDEELALLVEQERIDQLKRLEYSLCNMTNGGEGLTGLKHGTEARLKISIAQKNRVHGKHTEETKEKIRKAATGVVFTEERKKKIAEKAIGRKMSEETRLKSVGRRWKHKPETIEKMKKIQQAMPKAKCLHCDFIGNAGNLKALHNDNCKKKGMK